MKGKVQWFDAGKGYGFIKPKEGGADIFVHFSALQMDGYRTLDADDIVEFDVVDGPKGKPQADNVTMIQKAVV